jgi:hypothetical protein
MDDAKAMKPPNRGEDLPRPTVKVGTNYRGRFDPFIDMTHRLSMVILPKGDIKRGRGGEIRNHGKFPIQAKKAKHGGDMGTGDLLGNDNFHGESVDVIHILCHLNPRIIWSHWACAFDCHHGFYSAC